MMKLMGFSGFDTTKGKGVEDNKRGPAKGAISKHKAREYRQYMNRRGAWLASPVQVWGNQILELFQNNYSRLATETFCTELSNPELSHCDKTISQLYQQQGNYSNNLGRDVIANMHPCPNLTILRDAGGFNRPLDQK